MHSSSTTYLLKENESDRVYKYIVNHTLRRLEKDSVWLLLLKTNDEQQKQY